MQVFNARGMSHARTHAGELECARFMNGRLAEAVVKSLKIEKHYVLFCQLLATSLERSFAFYASPCAGKISRRSEPSFS